jgi:glycosyltransferase involved in cell wall biosynthesis
MLFVLNCLGVGGSEIKIIKIANALAKDGVAIDLAYLNPPDTSRKTVDSAVNVIDLKRRGTYSIPSLKRLRTVVKREQKTLIVVNLYPLLYAVPAVMLSKRGNRQAIAMVNTSVSMDADLPNEGLYAKFLARCDRIVFGCIAQQNGWIDKHKTPANRANVIYNGVDSVYYAQTNTGTEGQQLRKKLGIPADALVVGGTGRLAPEQSFDLLIDALARLRAAGRNASVLLIGRGDEREALEIHAGKSGVSRDVHFLGLQEDVRPAMSAMDVFVLPSSAVETFSNAALEAMSMGCAVVLSRIGGAAEMVVDGESGLLFPIGDVDALVDSLILLHDKPEMRRSLGAAARERIKARFEFTRMVDDYRRLENP